MIAIDTSAVLAILLLEPEEDHFLDLIRTARGVCMSAVNLHECAMVLTGRQGGEGMPEILERFISEFGVAVVPFGLAEVREAQDAFRRFGKGRHPAARNMGDCAAYALARSRRIPLLYKGNDFRRTDLAPAFRPH